MGRETITYTEEVEQTEELIVCDGCTREVDEEGGREGNFYFCSQCKEEMRGQEAKSEYVERVEEWLETKDSAGDTMRRNIRTYFLLMLVSNVTFAIGAFLPTASLLFVALFGGIATFGGLVFGTALLSPKRYPGA